MKRKITAFLIAVCAVSLIGGCGGEGNNDKEQNTAEGTEASDGAASYNVDECVKLGEYKGLEVTLGAYEVKEEDVKSNIETTLASYPNYVDTDKTTVEEGDIANIDYEGLKDGVAFEGGTAQGANLEIGSNSFIDGFEDGLIGKKVGEDVELNLTFPEDYQNTELAGQAVVFKVKINKIVKEEFMTYDTVTDEFVANNFVNNGYQKVDDLKKGVREQLESNNESQKKTDTQNAIFEKLHETCTVTMPDGLLEQRIQEYMDQFTENLKTNYNMELSAYLSSVNTTEDEFNQQVRQYIEDSLTNQLILEAIAKKESIELDEEGYAKYKQDIITEFSFESEDALIEQYGEDYVKNAYISDKTMDFVIDNAKITYDENAAAAADSTGTGTAPTDDAAAGTATP
jgi:trigger factor